MRQAGFVLTGGRSRRMGRDKAMLPYCGKQLLDYIARQVLEATGGASLIGRPELYGHLGYPVYPDEIPHRGPLGGILTALRLCKADWNLVVACDLPYVRAGELRQLLQAAVMAGSSIDCVVPVAPDGSLQPLCAVYHARCVSAVDGALSRHAFKARDLVAGLDTIRFSGLRPELFVNVNTPADWEKIEKCQSSQ